MSDRYPLEESNISSPRHQTLEETMDHPAQPDPLIKPPPDPYQENPQEKVEEVVPAEEAQVNPGITPSHPTVSVEVSAGPTVSPPSDEMLISPAYNPRRPQKRKKGKGFGSFKKQQAIEKKLQTLVERLNLVPFVPSRALDFDKHEVLLGRLGLWDFVTIGLGFEFNKIRADLVAQLIATYDPKSRCSYVNDFRIKVNRADLARVFKLPVKMEKNVNAVVGDGLDVDPVAVSEDSIAFLEDFVSSWIVLHNDEELWMMPDEVVNLTKAIKDGHPEKVDWSTLLWFMVEKELMRGEQLVDCYYASHLQYLIRSQREELLSREPVEIALRQEPQMVLQNHEPDELILMEDSKNEEACNEILEKKADGDGEEVLEENDHGKKEEIVETKDDVKEEPVLEKKDDVTEDKVLEEEDHGKKEDVVEKKDDVKEELVLEKKDDVKEEPVLEKKDDAKEDEVLEKKDDVKEDEVLEKKDAAKENKVEKKNDVKEDEVLEKKDDAKENKVEKKNDDGIGGAIKTDEDGNEGATNADKEGVVREKESNVIMGGPSFELNLGQEFKIEDQSKDVEMVEFGEFKYSNVEQDQRHWLLDGNNNASEHFLQRCSIGDYRGMDGVEEKNDEIDDVEEEEEEGVVAEDEFDVVPAIDDLEGKGFTGNFLGSMEATQLACHPQGYLDDQHAVDLIESHNELQHMDASNPSFYGNTGKRKIDHDFNTSYHALNSGNKRLRIKDTSNPLPVEFGVCVEQMQLLLDRVRTMYMEKEQEQEQSNLNQQILLNELQKHDAVIDSLHKMKREEIEKRDFEIYRLNRELFLMCNLLEDYRKALKRTEKLFSEYRLKYQLLEEPIYKDAGPGGAVLSTTGIEKQCQKEEDECRVIRSVVEQKAKEVEDGYAFRFGEFMDKLDRLDKRLLIIENDFKSLKDLRSRLKDSGTCVLPAND